jgi:hypothetical protein
MTVKRITSYTFEGRVVGIELSYDQETLLYGQKVTGSTSNQYEIPQRIVAVSLRATRSDKLGVLVVTSLTVRMSGGQIINIPPKHPTADFQNGGPAEDSKAREYTTRPPGPRWSLKGFWGQSIFSEGGFDRLGVIWGLDTRSSIKAKQSGQLTNGERPAPPVENDDGEDNA